MIRRLLSALMVIMLLAPMQVLAVQPDEVLSDPLLETRARGISANLRCLVCQNQSIDDSDADLARDLRLLVRERLVAGDSDTEVFDYVVARYGEFVLLRPVMAVHTIILWVAAPVILIIGLIFVVIGARRKKAPPKVTPMTDAEKAALDRLSQD